MASQQSSISIRLYFKPSKMKLFKFLRTNGEGLSWNDLDKKTLPFIPGKVILIYREMSGKTAPLDVTCLDRFAVAQCDHGAV